MIETLKKLKEFLGDGSFPLHEPNFSQEEEKCVLDCIKTGWVSSVGKYVDQFERDLEKYTGCKKAVVVMNGTSALHIAYLCAGVMPKDEVLCPSLTFVATANAIRYCNAIPHFVEIEDQTLGIDPEKLRKYLCGIGVVRNNRLINKETNRNISALVVTHIFGHPSKILEIKSVCDEFGIALIEDAAEALGSFYEGTHVGNFGKCSALSFNGNKIITTGGGGAILTNDDELGIKIKHITTTAKIAHPWEYVHDQLGFNYRMPNINAALGCAQLAKIEDFILRKRKIASIYKDIFKAQKDFYFMEEPEHARSNYWLNAIILKKPDANFLNDIVKITNQEKIHSRPIWKPLHLLSYFQNNPRMNLSLTEEMEKRIINLPSSPGLIK